MELTFEQLPAAIEGLTERTNDILEILLKMQKKPKKETKAQSDFYYDYIPKKDVRNKLASSATLWKWEKAGKLKSYGIGGKRYYKRTDIENLFTPMK